MSSDRDPPGIDPLLADGSPQDPRATPAEAPQAPDTGAPGDSAPGDMLLDPEAIAEDEALFFGDDAWIRFRRPWGSWRRLLVLAGGLALVLGGA